jgi:hypothetical protein
LSGQGRSAHSERLGTNELLVARDKVKKAYTIEKGRTGAWFSPQKRQRLIWQYFFFGNPALPVR